MKNDKNNNGKYLYAVVSAHKDQEEAYEFSGIEGETVYTICNGHIAAVVSDISSNKIRPSRQNIAAHQEVLKQLIKEATPLPMAFGIIADSTKAIKRILTTNKQIFLDHLTRVGGKVEMGLRVTWDVPNIFEYFVDKDTELRVTRDRFFRALQGPTQQEKIELGRIFDSILSEEREKHTERVEEILSKCCFEFKRNKCRNEKEVMNLACLVGREARPEFENGVFKAASLFDNNFAFDYNGPWAPHNFVEIEIKF